MDYLTQFVVTVPEYEIIYDQHLLTQLCQLQSQLSDELHKFATFTPYRNVWHLANYFACLAPSNRVNCSYLTPEDIVGVRKVSECESDGGERILKHSSGIRSSV